MLQISDVVRIAQYHSALTSQVIRAVRYRWSNLVKSCRSCWLMYVELGLALVLVRYDNHKHRKPGWPYSVSDSNARTSYEQT